MEGTLGHIFAATGQLASPAILAIMLGESR